MIVVMANLVLKRVKLQPSNMLRITTLLVVFILVCFATAQNDFDKLRTKTLQVGDLLGLLGSMGDDNFDDSYSKLNITKPGSK
ncbi:hypothetical protein RRG08_041205 [Elysia crispata]|uniref:Uncharacterized protein n=1 Tax=Elysia crispata TaxID=231223 RepID=A0AAE1B842_9GAST|nr:hypothetical protein RRG08_041205 [Elysia crispata]